MNIRLLLTFAAFGIVAAPLHADELPSFGSYAGTVRFTTRVSGEFEFKHSYSVRAKAVFVPSAKVYFFPGGGQAGDVGVLIVSIASPTVESVSPPPAPPTDAQPAGVFYFRVNYTGGVYEVFDTAGNKIVAESPLPTLTKTSINLLMMRGYNSATAQNSALIRLRRIGP